MSDISIELTPSSPYRFQAETIGSTSSPQIRIKKPLLIPAQTSNAVSSSSRTKHTQPLRTTKTSQKLVLLPEEEIIPASNDEASEDEMPVAERLTKEVRDNKHYPRVTAYCIAEGFYLGILMEFLRKEHNVQPKFYDECLYSPYHFPLVSGENTEIASSFAVQSPNGHTFIDRQIENYENNNDISQYFSMDENLEERSGADAFTTKHIDPLTNLGEVFYFDYGVAVIWNFTEEQEHSLLNDIARSGVAVRPLRKDDLEVETFHFQYDIESNRQPRIFNDMITLKTDHHMIKLTISHAISQSTKLSLYEWQMDNTIERTKLIPKMLAQTGRLNLDRVQVTKLSGGLFKLRMDVNLVSNVLDTPEIFWSEPSLGPLYNAIRSYLEIPQRVKLLNERCSIISDLLDMLREDIGNSNMTRITWIIIWLIVIAVFVAIGEIAVKALNNYG
ncbi:unnamed protein product [Rhizophagus irregularis]|uniref:DUF155-domain-containing protein n=1 Tax=Rhizophagus irregularis TaxID=588596 RepID=A0A2I1GAZ3_9GLOM|nr:DUF155-domain-containing protein [Rhizophagus irregularis]CAB4435699.1 unnamed protein product [Rhizophagus irregularis]